ncbi:unnamed protein product [Cercospora beticola]|nr:unnamed protein product [Cercospora beticola]
MPPTHKTADVLTNSAWPAPHFRATATAPQPLHRVGPHMGSGCCATATSGCPRAYSTQRQIGFIADARDAGCSIWRVTGGNKSFQQSNPPSVRIFGSALGIITDITTTVLPMRSALALS